MALNILITGVSGYIGGSILDRLLRANIVPSSRIWGIVRSDDQAKRLDASKINLAKVSLTDDDAVKGVVLENQIDVVIHTASAVEYTLAGPLLKALKLRRENTKRSVHFIHTSGASVFADKTGWVYGPAKESDNLLALQKEVEVEFAYSLRETDIAIHETADIYGVNVYTVVPPLVYGRGTGAGNTVSVQIPTLIRVAIAEKQVYRFEENTKWPAVHVGDLAQYYARLTHRILDNAPLASGKDGYYLVSGHEFEWHDVLEALAKELFSRKLVSSPDLGVWPSQEFITKALGVPPPFSNIAWNSNAVVLPERHRDLGWQPEWDYERFLQSMGEEIETVQENSVGGKTLADLLSSS